MLPVLTVPAQLETMRSPELAVAVVAEKPDVPMVVPAVAVSYL